MRKLIRACALLVFLAAFVGGCGDNTPASPDADVAAETSSALVCDRTTVVSNGHGGFTHLCLHWAPSNLPTGGPCGAAQLEFPVPDGAVAVYTQPNYAGYCQVLFPGNYPTLGDWSGAYQILSMRTGPRAYAFWFSGFNYVNFAGFQAPNDLEPQPGWSVSSLQLLLGQ